MRIDWEFGIDMYILLYLKQIRLKRDFLIDIITNTMDMNLSKLQEIAEDRGTWCAIVHRVTKSQT